MPITPPPSATTTSPGRLTRPTATRRFSPACEPRRGEEAAGEPPSLMAKRKSDTAGEFWSGGGARSAGRGAWGRPEPVPETTEVDSGRRRDVLQVNLGQPTIARPAQPEGAHALRDGALDPGPSGIK